MEHLSMASYPSSGHDMVIPFFHSSLLSSCFFSLAIHPASSWKTAAQKFWLRPNFMIFIIINVFLIFIIHLHDVREIVT